MTRFLVLFVMTVAVCFGPAGFAGAQSAPTIEPGTGVIEGSVSTQSGSVRLAGALVTVRAGEKDIASTIVDADGRYRFSDLKPGNFQVTAALDGFDAKTAQVAVVAGKVANASFDLPIASFAQRVEVTAPSAVVPNTGTLSGSDSVKGKEMEQLAPTGGFQAALRLLASVLEVPRGLSIKGGRPDQSSVQIGSTTLVDPSTGFTRVTLPDDAIESVEVMPNPYAVEFGRFSSGLVVLEPRRAGDQWRIRLNSLEPDWRNQRNGNPFSDAGFATFGPRVETGGPLIKNRLFLEQTAQFRVSESDVSGRPINEVRTDRWFSTFTRVDANLSPKQSLVATGGVFPRVAGSANLGTFTPPDATVDLHSNANYSSTTERALWSDTFFTETSVQIHRYETLDLPHATAPMQLQPETTLGNFYNTQSRETSTFQVVEAGSGSRNAWGGLHLYKFGIDLLYNDYNGSSASRSVLIRRPGPDGTLARRLDFASPTQQTIQSTDVALFVQDRLQPATRWYVEFGGRLDRDGITNSWNPTPRVGSALVLNSSATAVIRGGFGLFYERTPSTAGIFGRFENYVDSRFDTDGVTPVAPPVFFSRVAAADLQTPRSMTWDIAYDHRLTPSWALHAAVIDRSGTHELIVNPEITGTSTGELRLDSIGQSRYREAEVGVHFSHKRDVDLDVTYVRSSSRGDLNALTNYFDTMLWPVVGRNQYAPANDVPNRLTARGRAMPTETWLILGEFDWRTGLPYSVVNEYLDFVGDRNSMRFPGFVRTVLGIEHRVKILKFHPWFGIRVYNAFQAFLPSDVQANIASPAFGSFYATEYRRFRIQFRFER